MMSFHDSVPLLRFDVKNKKRGSRPDAGMFAEVDFTMKSGKCVRIIPASVYLCQTHGKYFLLNAYTGFLHCNVGLLTFTWVFHCCRTDILKSFYLLGS